MCTTFLHNSVLYWDILHLFIVLKCLNFSTWSISLWFSTDYGPELVEFYHGGIFFAEYGLEMVNFYHRGIFFTDYWLEMLVCLYRGHLLPCLWSWRGWFFAWRPSSLNMVLEWLIFIVGGATVTYLWLPSMCLDVDWRWCGCPRGRASPATDFHIQYGVKPCHLGSLSWIH